MGKALQKSTDGGTTFEQVSVDVADYTLITGQIANKFCSIKDSKNNIFIFCGANTDAGGNGGGKGKIIKISSTGVKTSATLNWAYSCYPQIKAVLHRDEIHATIETYAYAAGPHQYIYLNVSLVFNDGDLIPEPTIGKIQVSDSQFAIYKDQYIWVASGTTVSIYDYDTKARLASETLTNARWDNITCNANNEIFTTNAQSNNGIYRFTFDVISGISITKINSIDPSFYRQLLIDRFGDIIALYNYEGASTLLKYTTAGVQVGTTLDLSGAYYNLNTDSDGNYYYSNDLGTYKIAANTAQGQAFNTPSKIRDNGMTTYGNNMTGYSPAVNA